MRNCFFDTSALAKKYLIEDGTEAAIEIFAKAEYVFISALTEVEIIGAIERAKWTRRITSPDYRQATYECEQDLTKANLTKVGVDEAIIQLGKKYVRQHRLRTADSIQLATALLASKKLNGDIHFICSDQTLLDAARLERLPCVDVRR